MVIAGETRQKHIPPQTIEKILLESSIDVEVDNKIKGRVPRCDAGNVKPVLGKLAEYDELNLIRRRALIYPFRAGKLGRPDSNQDIRIQSPLCYRCTTPQHFAQKRPGTERPEL